MQFVYSQQLLCSRLFSLVSRKYDNHNVNWSIGLSTITAIMDLCAHYQLTSLLLI